MSFNPITQVVSTSYGVKTVPSVSEFIKNIQELEAKWVKLGFTVTVNIGTTGDECWDGPITEVALQMEKKVTPEQMIQWEKSAADIYKKDMQNTIAKFRKDNSSETFKDKESELLKRITELKKQYDHVLKLKNNNPDDQGVFSARRGYEKVEEALTKLKAEHLTELNNPSSDETIIARYFAISFEDYKLRTYDLLLDIVTEKNQ